ncbi:hypothetical protein ATO46_14890 [Aeromonas schubertii]|uniref:virulence-associated V antigen n=1 Tax=Aeromonas schubertii TaxID=652 RepID=UPI00067F588F|nr:virulence-associated V antigen [Aeromonas schubertii]KUE80850.1 hypothetical protein ATO46_14890 [Aeromonas schubertii]
MQIRSYNDNPQGFLDDLGRVNLDQLTGSHSSELDPLLRFIREKGIQISASGSSPFINEELLKKMLAYFMPEDAIVKGGHLDRQIRGGIEHLKELLTSAVAGSPTAAAKTTWSLQEFMAMAHFSLTGDRVDDDVIGVIRDTMTSHNDKRNDLKVQVTKLTAELKIYSLIQSSISSAQSHSSDNSLSTSDPNWSRFLNLNDHRNYGVSTYDKFMESAEFSLIAPMLVANMDASTAAQARPILESINQLDNALKGDKYTDAESRQRDKNLLSEQRAQFKSLVSGRPLSMKQFLESPLKDTGALTGVSDSYSYNKDNNKLGNFATTVSDKSKPLNDKLSQKTTELNDISSRYNSAIEALNKFIQKYESMMQQILQAI